MHRDEQVINPRANLVAAACVLEKAGVETGAAAEEVVDLAGLDVVGEARDEDGVDFRVGRGYRGRLGRRWRREVVGVGGEGRRRRRVVVMIVGVGGEGRRRRVVVVVVGVGGDRRRRWLLVRVGERVVVVLHSDGG